MAAQGSLAADASPRLGMRWLVMLALTLPGAYAWADQADTGSARFRIDAQLRPGEGRYALSAELRTNAPPRFGQDRFTIKQRQAPDATCGDLGDPIFADQFE